ncbi:MAG: hypothetical protein N2442_12895 [Spirochaetes bacterium]|nr:hypothetical protein [Spirochaetota bacterium]
MKRIPLTEEDARQILDTGSIPDRILCSASAVAVVLTQSWCPQWLVMDDYLHRWASEEPDGEDVQVYHLEYDRLPFFSRFLAWKEETFKNYDIPYVRFYRKGTFVGDANFLDLEGFKASLKP